jgi:hypothetical protein
MYFDRQIFFVGPIPQILSLTNSCKSKMKLLVELNSTRVFVIIEIDLNSSQLHSKRDKQQR